MNEPAIFVVLTLTVILLIALVIVVFLCHHDRDRWFSGPQIHPKLRRSRVYHTSDKGESERGVEEEANEEEEERYGEDRGRRITIPEVERREQKVKTKPLRLADAEKNGNENEGEEEAAEDDDRGAGGVRYKDDRLKGVGHRNSLRRRNENRNNADAEDDAADNDDGVEENPSSSLLTSSSSTRVNYWRSFLAVSTKALKRACIVFYVDADMQQFVSSWMTLIDQSERRDLDCVNRLKVALASERTAFRTLKKAVNDVRLSGVVGSDGLANAAERRLLIGSLEKMATAKENIFEKAAFISAKGMISWYRGRTSTMDNMLRWFLRLILSELQNREAATRTALERIAAVEEGEEEEEARVKHEEEKILQIPSALFEARQCGLSEDVESNRLMIRCERVALEAIVKNPRDEVAAGFERLLTVKGTLENLKYFVESREYNVSDGRLFHFVMNLLQKMKKREMELTNRLKQSVARKDIKGIQASLRDYRKAGISGEEIASSATANPTTTNSSSPTMTQEAESILLDAVVSTTERDGFLEEFRSQFECISADSIAHGVSKAKDIFPEVREMLKKFYHNKREQMTTVLRNLQTRLNQEGGSVGAGGRGGGGREEEFKDDIVACRALGLTAENETVLKAELRLVKHLASSRERQRRRQQRRQQEDDNECRWNLNRTTVGNSSMARASSLQDLEAVGSEVLSLDPAADKTHVKPMSAIAALSQDAAATSHEGVGAVLGTPPALVAHHAAPKFILPNACDSMHRNAETEGTAIVKLAQDVEFIKSEVVTLLNEVRNSPASPMQQQQQQRRLHQQQPRQQLSHQQRQRPQQQGHSFEQPLHHQRDVRPKTRHSSNNPRSPQTNPLPDAPATSAVTVPPPFPSSRHPPTICEFELYNNATSVRRYAQRISAEQRQSPARGTEVAFRMTPPLMDSSTNNAASGSMCVGPCSKDRMKPRNEVSTTALDSTGVRDAIDERKATPQIRQSQAAIAAIASFLALEANYDRPASRDVILQMPRCNVCPMDRCQMVTVSFPVLEEAIYLRRASGDAVVRMTCCNICHGQSQQPATADGEKVAMTVPSAAAPHEFDPKAASSGSEPGALESGTDRGGTATAPLGSQREAASPKSMHGAAAPRWHHGADATASGWDPRMNEGIAAEFDQGPPNSVHSLIANDQSEVTKQSQGFGRRNSFEPTTSLTVKSDTSKAVRFSHSVEQLASESMGLSNVANLRDAEKLRPPPKIAIKAQRLFNEVAADENDGELTRRDAAGEATAAAKDAASPAAATVKSTIHSCILPETPVDDDDCFDEVSLDEYMNASATTLRPSVELPDSLESVNDESGRGEDDGEEDEEEDFHTKERYAVSPKMLKRAKEVEGDETEEAGGGRGEKRQSGQGREPTPWRKVPPPPSTTPPSHSGVSTTSPTTLTASALSTAAVHSKDTTQSPGRPTTTTPHAERPASRVNEIFFVDVLTEKKGSIGLSLEELEAQMKQRTTPEQTGNSHEDAFGANSNRRDDREQLGGRSRPSSRSTSLFQVKNLVPKAPLAKDASTSKRAPSPYPPIFMFRSRPVEERGTEKEMEEERKAQCQIRRQKQCDKKDRQED